ncbi:hypothetical protein [Cupriavidus oxalaticus]|uniref:Uncharacterized protein n=1 Tax=Cupriavidus oxalaticus TaxID=96344 RepID=A0A375FPY7_9BURK|nr:hypothetical protein [Cupriavidus oxalaticus]QRQ85579.1 hypothetical protein JTE91_05855 [Cupriavidus oxalaticus]QRQ90333.1 hypothetical protein JTE92_06490 [Cupriavidus oxalaticus]WQD84845.1 hypothetical protein U0036_24610 [Cupriavidus oxalaticus]SPC07755.1 hypothetical protein CO2235_U770197 [Cupriavidus oxalaticus]SPC24412.1 hypothetical protein CO2235_MP80292 [Cupriavidus oxalaticus]
MDPRTANRWRCIVAGILGLALGIGATNMWYSPLLTNTTDTLRAFGEKLDVSEARFRSCQESVALAKKAGQDLTATLTERVSQAEAALATAQDDMALARKQAELAQKWANDQPRRPLVADSANACEKLDDLLTDTIKRRREQ